MPQEQLELSMEDDIAANLDSILSGNSDTIPQGDVGAGDLTEGGKDAATTGAGEGTASKPVPTSTDVGGVEDSVETTTDGTAQPQDAIEMPKSWGKAGAAIWETVPPEARSMIQKREEDFHRGISQYKQDADIGRTLSSAISPYMATINALQTTPEVAIKTLLNADHKLRYGNEEQKLQALAVIANDYGIDTSKLKPLSDLPAPDPQINLLNQRVSQLSSTIEEQQITALNNEITRFANDSANTHFNEVRPIMADLLEMGKASDLKDAYEKAIWMHPEVRSKLIAEQHKAEQQRLIEEKRKQDQIARQARGKRLPSTTSAATTAMPGQAASLDESIGSTLDDILARQG